MVKMDKLMASFEGLRFSDVATYIQSGNVVFQSKVTDAKELEKRIAKKIEQDFGIEVPVIVKEKGELINIFKNNPFIKRKADVAFLHVTFLSDEWIVLWDVYQFSLFFYNDRNLKCEILFDLPGNVVFQC